MSTSYRPEERRNALEHGGIDRLIEDLRTPTLVIGAYLQIIKRQLHRGDAIELRALLDHLVVIERSTQRIQARLRVAERDALRRHGS